MNLSESWDFYPCRVDDAPAVILVNLWFAEHGALAEAGWLYRVKVELATPGEHGIGEDDEADVLDAADETLIDDERLDDLHFVARIRTGGHWQLVFYGPADQEASLADACADHYGDRAIAIDHEGDADWTYYEDFLLPDQASWHWMKSRHLVDALADAGDVLETPRRVDHLARFPEEAGRDAFARAAGEDGFSIEGVWKSEEEDDELPFTAQIHRVDAVQLDDIYPVVATLAELANEHGGEYDGWETTIER